MDIEVLGIDLGKTVCSLAGLDATGAVVFRKRLPAGAAADALTINLDQSDQAAHERGNTPTLIAK